MTEPALDLELRLVGYVPVVSHGFALPLYGQYHGSNTFYVAGCRPGGDHRGEISGFDPYEPESHRWLSAQRPDLVRVGDPWLDVFLWNDEVLVGNADELWTRLAPIQAELEELAPLSLLDAATNAGVGERDTLAPRAMAYVAERFGENAARHWRAGTLRRYLSVVVRRVAPSFVEPAVDQDSILTTDAHSARLRLPPPLVSELVDATVLDRMLDDLKRFAASFGLRLDLVDTAAPPPTKELDRDPEPPFPAQEQLVEAGAVLVLSSGKRARQIVRHVTSPGWLPVGATAAARHAAQRGTAAKVVSVIDAGDAHAIDRITGTYEVVVALYDDGPEEHVMARVATLLDRVAAPNAIRIFAPALPEHAPARTLISRRLPTPLLADCRFDAILDTAQARSPFWWGNPRRSLDRRIADIISGAACLCLSIPIADELRKNRSAEPALMVFAMEAEQPRGRSADPGLALESESTWAESGGAAAGKQVLFRQRSHVVQGDRARRTALLEYRIVGSRFEEFAVAVLEDLFGDKVGQLRPEPSEMPEPDGRLMRSLAFPELSFGVHIRRLGGTLRLLLTAETPTPAVLVAAAEADWCVVRYTDRDTLRMVVLGDRPLGERKVPAEVALGRLAASNANRRLATRGVDTRDIIRLTPDQVRAWLDRIPAEDRDRLSDEIRPVRASQEPASSVDPPAFALRRRRLIDGRFEDDPTVRALAGVLGLDVREVLDRRPDKRAADLEACWAPPAEGYTRFALADGEIPPVIAQLRPEEIVLQTFFILDGDWSVPALFRSRIFRIWAAATLSRSNSWMSRFSIGATFAGFPVPRPFRIVELSGEGAALENMDGDFVALARGVEGYIEGIANKGAGSGWKAAQYADELANLPDARQLEAQILAAYHLPPDADDLSILLRLIDMNRDLAKSSGSAG